jgi:hypothetical protein
MPARLMLGTVAVLLLLACSPTQAAPVANPTVQAQATYVADVQARMATATAVARANLPSGGLGLSQAQWEQVHGPPSKPAPSPREMAVYAPWETVQVSRNINAELFQRRWPPSSGPTQEEAKAEATKVFPADARFLRSYKPDADTTADLYHSDWLVDRFPQTSQAGGQTIHTWKGASPGDFAVFYDMRGGRVTMLTVGLGNNL